MDRQPITGELVGRGYLGVPPEMAQQGDVAQNWLETVMVPLDVLREAVATAPVGALAREYLPGLGVRKPEPDEQFMSDLFGLMGSTMPPGFYSNLQRMAQTGKVGKQMFGEFPKGGTFYKAAERAQVSPDELALIQDLRGGQKRVPRREIVKQVSENVPRLEKKVLGDPLAETRPVKLGADAPAGSIASINAATTPTPTSFVGLPKWEEYTLPGGKNYRENLWYYDPELKSKPPAEAVKLNSFDDLMAKYTLVSPDDHWKVSSRAGAVLDDIRQGNYERARRLTNRRALESIERHINNEVIPEIKSKVSYQEPEIHYGVQHGKNLMMWSRTNDRQLPTGERVSHLEEAQSGWHDAGSKRGYGKAAKKATSWGDLERGGYRMVPETGRFSKLNMFIVVNRDGAVVAKEFSKEAAVESAIRSYNSVHASVPNAPYKKDWYKILARDLVRDAVEKGHDGVTWTTAKVQRERWRGMEEKAYQKFDDLYDRRLVKFFKNEYGVEPTKRVVDNPASSIDPEDVRIVRLHNGRYVGQLDDGSWLSEPTDTAEEAVEAFWELSGNGSAEIWYIPITPKVRQRILTEGQKLSKAQVNRGFA